MTKLRWLEYRPSPNGSNVGQQTQLHRHFILTSMTYCKSILLVMVTGSVSSILLEVIQMDSNAGFHYYNFNLWPSAFLILLYSVNLSLHVRSNCEHYSRCKIGLITGHAVLTNLILIAYIYLSVVALVCETNGVHQKINHYPEPTCAQTRSYVSPVSSILFHPEFEPRTVNDPEYTNSHVLILFNVVVSALVNTIGSVGIAVSAMMVVTCYLDTASMNRLIDHQSRQSDQMSSLMDMINAIETSSGL